VDLGVVGVLRSEEEVATWSSARSWARSWREVKDGS
jgi:hypothetical protein